MQELTDAQFLETKMRKSCLSPPKEQHCLVDYEDYKPIGWRYAALSAAVGVNGAENKVATYEFIHSLETSYKRFI